MQVVAIHRIFLQRGTAVAVVGDAFATAFPFPRSEHGVSLHTQPVSQVLVCGEFHALVKRVQTGDLEFFGSLIRAFGNVDGERFVAPRGDVGRYFHATAIPRRAHAHFTEGVFLVGHIVGNR